MTERAAFIARVRDRLELVEKTQAVIPEDWVPEIDDPIERFERELTAVGGTFHRATAADAGAVFEKVLAVHDRPRVVMTREVDVPSDAVDAVERAGGELLWWPEAGREAAAAAAIGVTAGLWAVAETGSVLITSASPAGRAPSLLTRVHVMFVPRDRLLMTVRDVFREIGEMGELPSNLVLITGPSKSADIENQLVKGVHAPGEVHVILVDR